MPKEKSPLLSIIVTAHSEGILLHKTLLGVLHSAGELTEHQPYELIVHVDNPTPATERYIAENADFLRNMQLFTNSFKDVGLARNFAVQKARGTYVALIDGDDLPSKNWFPAALTYLEAHADNDMVAHAETTVEFGDEDALVTRHGGLGYDIDSILSTYANRWNAIIMTKRQILLDHPFIPMGGGYGYEDWHLMNRLIYARCANVLIPETAMFIRRKDVNSRWSAHRSTMSVLANNPLLSFSNVRALDRDLIEASAGVALERRYAAIKDFAKRTLHGHTKLAAMGLHAYRYTRHNLTHRGVTHSIPNWLETEWKELHKIERQIFPSSELLTRIPTYDSITLDHWRVGLAYKRIVDSLRYDSYDYIIFCPWLNAGGADKYTIDYANTIQELAKQKRVMVIATIDTPSTWHSKLHPNIDFLSFGQLTHGLNAALQERLLEQLIENSGATYLHIINSELAYNFIYYHTTYITHTNKKVILTSFSQSIDKADRTFGYSHTHVPRVNDLATFITSDNQRILDVWAKEYGIGKSKLLLHRQPITLPPFTRSKRDRESLHVLWAARLCPEKMPDIVPKIGRLLEGHKNIKIDMYGRIDEGFNANFLKQLPQNVSYKGGFNGFNSLPVEGYDVLLYTSLFDGMPNILLEAGGAGLAVVSSDAGGIGELIQPDKTGLLVSDLRNTEPYATALLQLLNPDLQYKLARGLYEELEQHFSPKLYRKNVQYMLKQLGYLPDTKN